MKKYLVHVSTYWCGMDATYRAEAESEFDLYDLAEEAAYDNFQSYNLYNEILAENGYDSDEMTDEEIEKVLESIDESEYYSFSIEEFEDELEEWLTYEELK